MSEQRYMEDPAVTIHNAYREALAKIKRLETALDHIASQTCDHGPGFCPRDFARAALSNEDFA